MAAFGMTHAEVTGMLAQDWKLPPLLTTPILNHHKAEEVLDPILRKITDVTWLAGRCADVFVDEIAAPAIAQVHSFCLEKFGISELDCDVMLEEICKRTREVAPLFEINIKADVNYEAILKKANETLVELTLKTQQQAVTLQQQNQKLKEEAAIDMLTGLANRARFDTFLSSQFAEAQQRGQPMAVILLDLDHFKQINDTHGHQAGDQALRSVGKLIKAAVRTQDLAARYGGEEIALVMVNTNRATAAAVAESLRRALVAKPIMVGTQTVPVTASLGVALYETGCPLTSPPQLLKAADMALYAAKKGGRNCVRVFAFKAAA
jgi:diguanylate cyclase (GGDEF)-like protein